MTMSRSHGSLLVYLITRTGRSAKTSTNTYSLKRMKIDQYVVVSNAIAYLFQVDVQMGCTIMWCTCRLSCMFI